jgi:hypothetical protein
MIEVAARAAEVPGFGRGQPRPLSGKPDIEPTSSNEAKASKCWQ